MLLGARLGSFGGGAAPLPYDSEVEYIETDGTAWIDTGLPLASPFSCSADVQTLDSSACWLGEFYSNRRMYILYQASSKYGYGYYTGNSAGTVAVKTAKFHFDIILKSGEQSLKIDGVSSYQKTLAGNVNNGNNLWIGKVQWSSVIYPKIRVYAMTATSGSSSVDLIPVRVGQVGYLYDRVSGQLRGNAVTSGEIILGPDK